MVQAYQVMKCVICCPFGQSSNGNNTNNPKGIISYIPIHGITSMKNHVVNEYVTIII
jgi:hypothetical protein